MYNNKLDVFNDCLTLIDEYKFTCEIEEIVTKIGKLIYALGTKDFHYIDKLTRNILSNTNFENIPIRELKNPPKNIVLVITGNCKYLIDRLTFLGFKKIIEHELDKSIDEFGSDIKSIYNSLKLALDNKKRGQI